MIMIKSSLKRAFFIFLHEKIAKGPNRSNMVIILTALSIRVL